MFLLQIFFGVFVFGVFHGLVFLPVLLSLVGPAPYSTVSPAILENTDDSNSSSCKQLEINGHVFTQVSKYLHLLQMPHVSRSFSCPLFPSARMEASKKIVRFAGHSSVQIHDHLFEMWLPKQDVMIQVTLRLECHMSMWDGI